MICGSVPAGFDHDERVFCVLPGVDLLEPRAVRRRSGAGAVFPVARPFGSLAGCQSGLVPAQHGLSESESFDELRQIDHGTLILTTKRLAFLAR